MATTFSRELERLTHSGLELADPATDLRDREACDRSGEHVGIVSDVLIDPEQRRVRMLEVATDGAVLGIGRKHHLVPVEAVIGGDPRTVYLDRNREEILAGGEYHPAEGDAEEEQYMAAYRAFGLTPYWATDGDEVAAARLAGH